MGNDCCKEMDMNVEQQRTLVVNGVACPVREIIFNDSCVLVLTRGSYIDATALVYATESPGDTLIEFRADLRFVMGGAENAQRKISKNSVVRVLTTSAELQDVEADPGLLEHEDLKVAAIHLSHDNCVPVFFNGETTRDLFAATINAALTPES